jgi:diguanylate cyclase (GGDEF)-like protein
MRTIRNYFFYCGIEKDEYNKLKKDAYVSNFQVWKILHFLIAAIFAFLYATSFFDNITAANSIFYLAGLLYSVFATFLFFKLKKDSLIGQLLIYLTMSLLFLFGGFLSQSRPDGNATAFIAFLLVMPMFMIDKPFFMTIELSAASAVFLVWMHGIKPHDVWLLDLYNVVTYTVIGSFLNIIANAIRIREFVLTRKINLQYNTDELTGIRNKGALTREINEFLADHFNDKGILFILDVDRFKFVNDTYGHDVGDQVIIQLGHFLDGKFTQQKEIVGRFGGDEFIVFIKDTDDPDTARQIADDLVSGASESVVLPDERQKISISIGIAMFHGQEKNYSELFKKADTALYKAKATPTTDTTSTTDICTVHGGDGIQRAENRPLNF